MQEYLRTQLDGLPSPGNPDAAAYVQPPAVLDATIPIIYIWGGSGDEDRYTIPRARGQKRIRHIVTLYLQWVMTNDPVAARGFPRFIDALRAYLRGTITLPVALTDPDTGETSTLLNIGERIIWDYGTGTPMADQAMVQFNALIKLPMAEILNPA